MRFIANGDYSLPLHVGHYWAEQFYTWSFQRGAANPDGIMRLPARLIDVAVFAACGNLATGYFFLLSCLALSFGGFWWFTRSFLGVERWGIALVASLFYTCNPIFLGNLSKVGLILAASMLPMMLTALRQGFMQRRLSYLLIYVLALNVSLVHPFTFSVNLLVSGVYIVTLIRQHRTFVRDNMAKFALVIVGALLLNAYFLLPLASLGTLDKSALSSTVSSAPVDYTKLVDIANTGDIFTGLSLSKGVLKDYEFYSAQTWPFYFLGVFLFYGLLFGAYVRLEKRLKPSERQRFVIAIGLFLGLLALSTASFLRADVLLKFLIGLPGGWMFRSPLKWQLYMPALLMAALAIAIKYVRNGWRLKVLYAAFGLAFICMNGYLGTQVYHRLLTPRSFTYFSALNQTNLAHKHLLVADADGCISFVRDHPSVATELNEVFISQAVQVKHAAVADLDKLPVSQFDYVLTCAHSADESVLTARYALQKAASFAGGMYTLYRNPQPAAYVSVVTQPLQLHDTSHLSSKYQLTTQQLGLPFQFTSDSVAGERAPVSLQNVFDGLSPRMLDTAGLTSELRPTVPGREQLLVTAGTAALYYRVDDTTVTVSPRVAPNLAAIPATGRIPINVPRDKQLTFHYSDPAFTGKNLIGNPSLETGLWQKQVDDCNNYDEYAAIAMRLNTQRASQGKQSLELSATQHIACTSPTDIAVKPSDHLLLSFDYQSPDAYAGYFVGFDDVAQTTTSKRLPKTSGWQLSTSEVIVPAGAEHLHLVVYAYPDGAPGRSGVAGYDNFSLVRIPDVSDRFFVVSGQSPQTATNDPPRVDFRIVNPTKTVVHATASQPFYLATTESYHQQWQLSRESGQHGLATIFASPQSVGTHLQMNELFNGWRIDPAAICATESSGCTRNADGSYTLALVMTFAPQRWFYIGSLLSIVSFAGIGGYIAQDLWRHRRKER